MDRDRIVTILIVIGIFGGLVGGPILSLADYYASPERRFWTFLIPEFIGFGCLILMVICGKSKQRKKKYQPDGNDNYSRTRFGKRLLLSSQSKSSKKGVQAYLNVVFFLCIAILRMVSILIVFDLL